MNTAGPKAKQNHLGKRFGLWTVVAETAMRKCTNPKDASYERYGSRGVTVCDRWLRFPNFLDDMGHCPDGFSIDRIDNSKGYEPGNCRWASRITQNRNRSSTKTIFFRGELRKLWDIADMVGMKMSVIRNRLNNYRMTIDEAVTIPLHAKPRPCGDYI